MDWENTCWAGRRGIRATFVLSFFGLLSGNAWATAADDLFIRSFADGYAALKSANSGSSLEGCKQLGLVQLAGGESTTGNAHTYQQPGRACFTGKVRPVRVCMIFPPDGQPSFGESKDSVQKDLKAAFDSWESYIQDHRIQSSEAKEAFSTKVDILSSCDGSEDLRVYFGTSDAAVKTGLDRNIYKEPWGLMSCTPPNTDGSWNKAIIWIAPDASIDGKNPDWSGKNKLQSVLLHEIGRMYGNGDVDGTIMRSNLSQWLSWKNPPPEIETLLTKIDWERSLYTEYAPSQDFKVAVPNNQRESVAASFERLMSRKPEGTISEQLTMDEGFTYASSGTIKLTDGIGSKIFHFTAKNLFSPCPVVGERIFTTGSAQSVSYSNSYSCSQMGSVQTDNGDKVPLVILRDADGMRYQLALPDVEAPSGNDLFRFTPFPAGYGQ